MADTPKKLIVDIEKGTHEYIELTPAEIAERDQMAAKSVEEATERQIEAERIADLKESAKVKLIAGEPLTGDEAAVLVI
jgi:hypothetical protein